MNTPTFQRIYDAELERTGSPARAYSRAVAANGFLLALARQDASDATGFARATHFRHKATLRRVGIAPIESPEALAALGRDLGVADRASLARLVWRLNTDRRSQDAEKRSLDRALETWDQFVTEAQELIAAAAAA
jgi:hypothetical protein